MPRVAGVCINNARVFSNRFQVDFATREKALFYGSSAQWGRQQEPGRYKPSTQQLFCMKSNTARSHAHDSVCRKNERAVP